MFSAVFAKQPTQLVVYSLLAHTSAISASHSSELLAALKQISHPALQTCGRTGCDNKKSGMYHPSG